MPLQPYRCAPGLRFVLLVCLTSALVSCGEDEFAKSGPRHPTIPVHGQVLVNGEPTARVILRFIPEQDHDFISSSRGRNITQAVTDAEGKFEVFTYKKGDGAPPGQYKIIMTLRERGASWGGNRQGPDRFGGKFSDSEETTFTVEVREDAEGPIVLEPFELEAELD